MCTSLCNILLILIIVFLTNCTSKTPIEEKNNSNLFPLVGSHTFQVNKVAEHLQVQFPFDAIIKLIRNWR